MYPVHPFPFSTELEGAHPLRFLPKGGFLRSNRNQFSTRVGCSHRASPSRCPPGLDGPPSFPFVLRSTPTKRPRYHPRRESAFMPACPPRAASECPARRLGVWLFLTHLSRTRVPIKRSFPLCDFSRRPSSATGCPPAASTSLRVTDFPMLHSPFSTCASSIVTSSVKSCATPSSA